MGEEKDFEDEDDASDVDVNDDGEIIEIDEETKRKRKRRRKIALVAAKTKKKLEKGKKMLKEALQGGIRIKTRKRLETRTRRCLSRDYRTQRAKTRTCYDENLNGTRY